VNLLFQKLLSWNVLTLSNRFRLSSDGRPNTNVVSVEYQTRPIRRTFCARTTILFARYANRATRRVRVRDETIILSRFNPKVGRLGYVVFRRRLISNRDPSSAYSTYSGFHRIRSRRTENVRFFVSTHLSIPGRLRKANTKYKSFRINSDDRFGGEGGGNISNNSTRRGKRAATERRTTAKRNSQALRSATLISMIGGPGWREFDLVRPSANGWGRGNMR